MDTFTENRIVNVPGEQIASIENGGIWVNFQELSDYHFMNIIVIGKKKFKTLCLFLLTNLLQFLKRMKEEH